MSNEQDPKNQEPKNVENEPQATDEIASEDLDQVVGGFGGGLTTPTLPPISPTSSTFLKYNLKGE